MVTNELAESEIRHVNTQVKKRDARSGDQLLMRTDARESLMKRVGSS